MYLICGPATAGSSTKYSSIDPQETQSWIHGFPASQGPFQKSFGIIQIFLAKTNIVMIFYL
jgi:hypothetical protein